MSVTFTLSDSELEKLLNAFSASEKAIGLAREVLSLAAKTIPMGTPAAPSEGVEAPASGDAWKSEPATERQLTLLEKNHIAVRAGLTKGEASALIDALLKKLKETKR
jgi:hypothetical protein